MHRYNKQKKMDNLLLRLTNLCIYIIVCIYTSFAQTALSESQNKPIVGDRIERHIVQGLSYDGSGDSMFWDFSNCTIVDDIVPITFATDTVGFKSFEPGIKNYYFQNEEKVLLRSSKSQYTKMNYTTPLLVMKYPLNYGDSISSPFAGNGSFCKSYNISHNGTSIILADAKGDIAIPGYMVLRDVLRIHIITFNNVLLEGLEPNLKDTATAKLKIDDEYHWYIKNCRYPIFEYRKSSSYNNGELIGSQVESYCFLPDSVINSCITYEDFYFNTASSTINKTEEKAENPIDYSMSQTGYNITFSYQTTTDATILFIVTNTQGMVLQNKAVHCKKEERNSTYFNCNGYKPGEYVLYINTNGIVNSEKFQIK